MRLLIVESPTKAKKIRSYLGRDYTVEASFGHIRDLPPSGGIAIDFSQDDQRAVTPHYVLVDKGRQQVPKLVRAAQDATEVLLATDPDREGEAIAWHLAEILRGKKVSTPMRRVIFHAITKDAVAKALASPRDLDDHLIGAQQARRVLDRVVGWVVSPVLRRGLDTPAARSAGRVQSVALRLVAEREKTIQAFTAKDYFTLDGLFEKTDSPPPFPARLIEWKGEPLAERLADAATAQAAVDWCTRQPFVVTRVQDREELRRAPPPFITSTVQQAASVALKMNPEQCMRQLQQLFENGHITYHRTDSVQVDPSAIAAARNWIGANLPPDYLPKNPNTFAQKSAQAQEAHEAIRPTDVSRGADALGGQQTDALYALIWRRFIASQMAPGRDRAMQADLSCAPGAFQHPKHGAVAVGLFRATGRARLFDGWRRLGDDATDEKKPKKRTKKSSSKNDDSDDDGDGALLPPLAQGDAVQINDLKATARRTKAPPRFTQASLIKKLEQEGIGRPSTYAAIMQTLRTREYVQEKQRKLHATDLGIRVTDYLIRHFARDFIELDFTRRMEATLDQIASGQIPWQATIHDTAIELRSRAQQAGFNGDPLSNAPREKRPPAEPDPAAEPCPLCAGPMCKRSGRFGEFFACLKRSCDGTRNPDNTLNRKMQRQLEQGASATPAKKRTRKAPAKKTATKKPRAKPSSTSAPACPECGADTQSSQDPQGRRVWLCARFPSCSGEVPAD